MTRNDMKRLVNAARRASLAALLCMGFIVLTAAAQVSQVPFADPYVLLDGDTYYAYGTHSNNGIEYYSSKDLKNWTYGGLALSMHDTNMTRWFWAPEVYHVGEDRYVMYYSANERLFVALGSSPKGPFIQHGTYMMWNTLASSFCIDSTVFFDDDGTPYLFHVRLQQGNRIFVSEMNSDLRSVKEETTRQCIVAEQPWENTDRRDWSVSEGPTVVKMGKTYYLFYSCNDFRNPDYAVGYATAKSPLGPWKKQKQPIISRTLVGQNGTGHGDLFQDAQGQWQYVMHTHDSASNVSPRRTAIITLEQHGKKWVARPETFKMLTR